MVVVLNGRRLINKVTKRIYRVVSIDGEDVFLRGSGEKMLWITPSELHAHYDLLMTTQK